VVVVMVVVGLDDKERSTTEMNIKSEVDFFIVDLVCEK
jgi:hypothetical protein